MKHISLVQEEISVELSPIVNELNSEYEKYGKGLKIQKIGGGYQVLSQGKYHIYIERLFKHNKKLQLSRPALEALSIIAYRQPVSKAEVESIRGVECGSVVNTLMERELITVKSRGKTAGRPLLFGTTQTFLKSFGLEKTSDLPKLKELSEECHLHTFPYQSFVLYKDNYPHENKTHYCYCLNHHHPQINNINLHHHQLLSNAN